MSVIDFDKLFEDFSKIKIGVIGDVMLDTYWWGHVERISPEAPVPIVSLDRREFRIGGAGNVALNLASLGATVNVLSVLGQDEDGHQLKDLLEKKQIHTSYIQFSDSRITTNKARIISMNQQMLRLDSETTKELSVEDESKLLQWIDAYVEAEKPNVLIFEDYNKGVLTQNVIRRALKLCHEKNIFTAVDPKKNHFFSYIGVSLFKPNLSEVKQALNISVDLIDVNTLEIIHKALEEKIHHQISFITLSDKGVFYKSRNEAEIIPSHMRRIADVSGAGDTVIAVASLVYVATKNVKLMAEVANIAGGLVCEEVGTVAIDKTRLLGECKRLL